MRYEVESKFPIHDPQGLAREFAARGVVWGEAEQHADSYFNHPARDFAQTDEALRIRQIGDVNHVTYKGPKIDTTTKTRREIELPLAAGAEMARGLSEMLSALGFRPVATVRKERRHGALAWQGFEVTLAWDNAEALGEFLELEIVAPEAQMHAARDAIVSLAADLKLGAAERRSYLEMLLAARGK
ncbi:MAG: class IV adenylate cyclase [Planctomycetes bacterium]|nr:class IV adenylate cyclase [Planctomycetota bacterium]